MKTVQTQADTSVKLARIAHSAGCIESAQSINNRLSEQFTKFVEKNADELRVLNRITKWQEERSNGKRIRAVTEGFVLQHLEGG